jgi:hypothetical protein
MERERSAGAGSAEDELPRIKPGALLRVNPDSAVTGVWLVRSAGWITLHPHDAVLILAVNPSHEVHPLWMKRDSSYVDAPLCVVHARGCVDTIRVHRDQFVEV